MTIMVAVRAGPAARQWRSWWRSEPASRPDSGDQGDARQRNAPGAGHRYLEMRHEYRCRYSPSATVTIHGESGGPLVRKSDS
jgi:hypothetical protein